MNLLLRWITSALCFAGLHSWNNPKGVNYHGNLIRRCRHCWVSQLRIGQKWE